jgi:uncharacterized protein (TIRG00374 family)
VSGSRPRGISSPRLWLGIAVSAVCIVLVSRRIDWVAFAHALASVNPIWLVGAAAFNVLSYVFTGFRWRQVVAPQTAMPVRDAYDAVVIGNLATLVAPSRAGDLAKAAFVARKQSIPVSRVLGAVAVERFGDVAMLILLAAALWFVVAFPPMIRAGVTAFTIAGVAALAALLLAADWLPALAGRCVRLVSPSWEPGIRGFLEGIFSGFKSAGGVRRFPGTLFWSLMIWISSAVAMACVVKAFQLPVPWYAASFVLLVVNLGGVIPASPGSIGLYHYLAVVALTVWAVDPSVALGFAVVAHAAGIVVVLLVGLGGLARQHESLFAVRRSAAV